MMIQWSALFVRSTH